MKIRSDFVTNSSSSSFILAVKKGYEIKESDTITKEDFEKCKYNFGVSDLDPWDVCYGQCDNEDYYEGEEENNISYRLYAEINEFETENIKFKKFC